MLKIEDKKRVLREMLFARRFEERCYEAYVERNIGGFLHLYPGEEACAFGVLEAATVGHDYVITSYRDHIHAIKAGSDPRKVMAELFSKETGVSKGRGGSMHIFDVEHRFMRAGWLSGGVEVFDADGLTEWKAEDPGEQGKSHRVQVKNRGVSITS